MVTYRYLDIVHAIRLWLVAKITWQSFSESIPVNATLLKQVFTDAALCDDSGYASSFITEDAVIHCLLLTLALEEKMPSGY